MAFLIVGGVTVPVVHPDGAGNEVEEIGDRDRAFLGGLLSSTRARKYTWPIRPRLLTSAEYATLKAVLVGTMPVSCSGDLLGATVSCDIRITTDLTTTVGGGVRRYVLGFDLIEV